MDMLVFIMFDVTKVKDIQLIFFSTVKFFFFHLFIFFFFKFDFKSLQWPEKK